VSGDEAAQVMGLTEKLLQRAFDHFVRKRNTTEYLRMAPVDIT